MLITHHIIWNLQVQNTQKQRAFNYLKTAFLLKLYFKIYQINKGKKKLEYCEITNLHW